MDTVIEQKDYTLQPGRRYALIIILESGEIDSVQVGSQADLLVLEDQDGPILNRSSSVQIEFVSPATYLSITMSGTAKVALTPIHSN